MNALVPLLGLAGLAACALAGPPRAGEPQGSALGSAAPSVRLAVERPAGADDQFLLTALYDGPPAAGLTYRLTVRREGAAGRSQSAQSGAVASGGGLDTLSTLRVNAGPGDRLEAELTLSRGETIVARDRYAETVAATP